MTRSQALAALRRALLPALLAGGLALALVLALLLTRDPLYEARIGIVATPVEGVDVADPSYGSVVSLTMPAIPEMALSAPVLSAVQAELPTMDEDTLTESVAVELVPASGVARITVTGEDARTASTVLGAVVDEIVGSDLLLPAATVRVVGDMDAAPTLVEPDPPLALGLALLAAAVVALLAVAAVQVLRPRLLTLPDVERVVHDVSGPVPVVPFDRRPAGLELLAARVASAAPGARRVRAVPAGPSVLEGLTQAIDARLASAPAHPLSGPRTGDHQPVPGAQEPVLVTVRLRRTSAEDLTAALLAAQRGGLQVVLVVAG